MVFQAVIYNFLLLAAIVFLTGYAIAGDNDMLTLSMPGKSYQGTLPELTAPEKTIEAILKRHINAIAGEIGERNTGKAVQLQKAADYIELEFAKLGYQPGHQIYEVNGTKVANIVAELPGRSKAKEILIIGAHYDTIAGSPGANDNTSGVAALLELARLMVETRPERTLRFVAFVNEEPPFFMTGQMGSWVYAKRCRQLGEQIVGMISLETIGYYSDEKGSQKYPFPLNFFFPDTGNFIGFAANTASANFLKQVIGLFRNYTQFPSEGGAVPEMVEGIGWSDHWAFWQEGYPAIMVTDSAPYRYPYTIVRRIRQTSLIMQKWRA